MIAPLSPHGLEALAALIALRGVPGAPHPTELLSAELSRALADQATDAPQARLAQVAARRTVVVDAQANQPGSAGRSPAARFLRRHHRRWRIAQAAAAPWPTDLRPLGRRAIARGWVDAAADPEVTGLRVHLWATPDPGRRRDLLAQAPVALARAASQAPPLPADRARALLP